MNETLEIENMAATLIDGTIEVIVDGESVFSTTDFDTKGESFGPFIAGFMYAASYGEVDMGAKLNAWCAEHSDELADVGDDEIPDDEPHVGHHAHFTGAWWCDTCNSPCCDRA
jgi:hypothetical protein